MGLENWLAFTFIWTLATIPLGPNALNCILTAKQYGFYKSLYCVLGLVIAASTYIAIVLVGLTTILVANAEIFIVIKFIGASYLIWMGAMLLRKTTYLNEEIRKTQEQPRSIIRRSMLISMTNPKAIFAYSAVFSQFVGTTTNSIFHLAVLISTSLMVVVLVYVVYCFIGAKIAGMMESKKKQKLFNRIIGSAYIFAGASLLAYEISNDAVPKSA